MKAKLIDGYFFITVKNKIEFNELITRFKITKDKYLSEEKHLGLSIPMFKGQNFNQDIMNYCTGKRNPYIPYLLDFKFDVDKEDAAFELIRRLRSSLGAAPVLSDPYNPDDYMMSSDGVSKIMSYANRGLCGLSCALCKLIETV